jgi:hypothetical protein
MHSNVHQWKLVLEHMFPMVPYVSGCIPARSKKEGVYKINVVAVIMYTSFDVCLIKFNGNNIELHALPFLWQ